MLVLISYDVNTEGASRKKHGCAGWPGMRQITAQRV